MFQHGFRLPQECHTHHQITQTPCLDKRKPQTDETWRHNEHNWTSMRMFSVGMVPLMASSLLFLYCEQKKRLDTFQLLADASHTTAAESVLWCQDKFTSATKVPQWSTSARATPSQCRCCQKQTLQAWECRFATWLWESRNIDERPSVVRVVMGSKKNKTNIKKKKKEIFFYNHTLFTKTSWKLWTFNKQKNEKVDKDEQVKKTNKRKIKHKPVHYEKIFIV